MIGRLQHKISMFIAALLLVASTTMSARAAEAAAADGPNLTDYDWQALYIVKFGLSYVEWPQITMSGEIKNINVCIFGDSPQFLKSLGNFQSKAAAKLKMNIKSDVSESGFASCNILYIAKNKTNYKDAIASAKGQPVLTVAPISGFADNGGIIEFVISESEGAGGAPFAGKVKVTFKLNYKAALAASLKISPELVELSEKVIR